MLQRPGGERVSEQDARAGDGRPSIVDLMAPVEARQREIEQMRRRLEDEAPMLLVHVEIAEGDMERRAD